MEQVEEKRAPIAIENLVSVENSEEMNNDSMKNYLSDFENSEAIGHRESELSRKDSVGSFEEDDKHDNHDYVNTELNVTYAKKSEVSLFIKIF